MEALKNKRLLVLGGTLSTYDVVKTAKKMGMHVTVTDYLKEGISKSIADDTALISTTDIEALSVLIKDKKIDGVFTGASEFNICNMIMLCEKAELPVYTSLEKWELFSNKKKFKETCRKYDVPVVPEYNIESIAEINKIQYPVIVKPVDSFSGHGISICNNGDELSYAVRNAKEWSKTKQVIIEKYMQGNNVEVYYLVQNGEVMLLTASDRYTNNKQNGSPVPFAFYHPSQYLGKYLQEVHPKVCNMFERLEVRNGVFFMESFLQDGEFAFYEMGFRLNATMEYHFVDYFNHFNPLEMMLRYAVTGDMGEKIEKQNNPYFPGKACEIALLLTPGIIQKIIGMDEVCKLPQVIHIIQYYKAGDSIKQTGSLEQNFARIKVVADTDELLEKVISSIYSTVSVQDKNGAEMLIKERN